MECIELVERVTDYLDDALDPTNQHRMDAHLGVCFGCQAYMRRMDVTLGLIAAAPALEPSDRFQAGLMDAFREWKRSA